MQYFYQEFIDDMTDLGLSEKAKEYNKKYKNILKACLPKESIFFVAYSIDIVA